jgi:hypothetical protein
MWLKDDEAPGDFWSVDTNEFIPDGIRDRARSHQFWCGNQELPCSFHLLFKEDFLVDKVSTENLSIQRTMNSMIPLFGNVHWRNNVLIVKAGKETDPKYEDLTVSDIPDAVDFLIKYTVTIQKG